MCSAILYCYFMILFNCDFFLSEFLVFLPVPPYLCATKDPMLCPIYFWTPETYTNVQIYLAVNDQNICCMVSSIQHAAASTEGDTTQNPSVYVYNF